jgi:hypothetical protein
MFRSLSRALSLGARPPAALPGTAYVRIRYAFADDAEDLACLAALDSKRPLSSPVLVAEVDGELHAALSLADRASVADPFRPTVELLELLALRAAQLLALRAAQPRVADAAAGTLRRRPGGDESSPGIHRPGRTDQPADDRARLRRVAQGLRSRRQTHVHALARRRNRAPILRVAC